MYVACTWHIRGMYVATSMNRAVAGSFCGPGGVKWQFTIPAGCRQVKDIRAVSQYMYAAEGEVTMVPYIAIRIDDKRSDAQGTTTISATALLDAYVVSEALTTILA